MNNLWMPTRFAKDDYGNIVVIKGTQSYLTEYEAQEACAIGCKPVEIQLPGYLASVIARGFDDLEALDGRDPEPEEFDWLQDLEDRAAKGDEEAIFHLENL